MNRSGQLWYHSILACAFHGAGTSCGPNTTVDADSTENPRSKASQIVARTHAS